MKLFILQVGHIIIFEKAGVDISYPNSPSGNFETASGVAVTFKVHTNLLNILICTKFVRSLH